MPLRDHADVGAKLATGARVPRLSRHLRSVRSSVQPSGTEAPRQLTTGILVIVLGAMLASCRERPEVLYPDAAAARQAGAVRRGWIPDWLPKSSRNIHEIHDLDTNQEMLAFSFSPADTPDLARLCKQVQRDGLKPVPFSVRWWPNDVPPSPLVTHRHVYHECPGGAYVAVSVQDGELFYWRP